MDVSDAIETLKREDKSRAATVLLLRALRDVDARIRYAAAMGVAETYGEPLAHLFIPVLVGLVGHQGDYDLRRLAAASLSESLLIPFADSTVQHLLDLLQRTPDPSIREDIIFGFEKLAQRAVAAAPTLFRQVRDSDEKPKIRRRSKAALAAILGLNDGEEAIDFNKFINYSEFVDEFGGRIPLPPEAYEETAPTDGTNKDSKEGRLPAEIPSDVSVEATKAAFDQAVDSALQEQWREMKAVGSTLDKYLQACASGPLSKDNQSEQEAGALAASKRDLADHVRRQLNRVGLAILYDDQPTLMMATANKRNRRGYFILMPQGKKTPVLTRADLSEFLKDASVSMGASLQVPLIPAAIRREGLADWRQRVREAEAASISERSP